MTMQVTFGSSMAQHRFKAGTPLASSVNLRPRFGLDLRDVKHPDDLPKFIFSFLEELKRELDPHNIQRFPHIQTTPAENPFSHPWGKEAISGVLDAVTQHLNRQAEALPPDSPTKSLDLMMLEWNALYGKDEHSLVYRLHELATTDQNTAATQAARKAREIVFKKRPGMLNHYVQVGNQNLYRLAKLDQLRFTILEMLEKKLPRRTSRSTNRNLEHQGVLDIVTLLVKPTLSRPEQKNQETLYTETLNLSQEVVTIIAELQRELDIKQQINGIKKPLAKKLLPIAEAALRKTLFSAISALNPPGWETPDLAIKILINFLAKNNIPMTLEQKLMNALGLYTPPPSPLADCVLMTAVIKAAQATERCISSFKPENPTQSAYNILDEELIPLLKSDDYTNNPIAQEALALLDAIRRQQLGKTATGSA